MACRNNQLAPYGPEGWWRGLFTDCPKDLYTVIALISLTALGSVCATLVPLTLISLSSSVMVKLRLSLHQGRSAAVAGGLGIGGEPATVGASFEGHIVPYSLGGYVAGFRGWLGDRAADH